MVKLNRIYTRTGDDGSTGLVDGSRRSKAAPLMQAIGDVDEANCAVGAALAGCPALDEEHRVALRRVQNELFDLGADLATPLAEGEAKGASLRVTAGQVARLEAEIDAMNAGLAPLTSFVLPGGAAAAVHLARAAVRRAERGAVAASAHAPLNPHALAYLNRLSDHLFVLARVVMAGHGGDILWVPGASR